MLNEERETLADIEQIKSGALSTLSLALSPATNARFGVTLLKDFSERNPLTRLKVVVAPSREIVHGVSDGRVGARIRALPARHAGVLRVPSLLPGDASTHDRGGSSARATRCGGIRHAALRTLPLITSYLEDSAPPPGSQRIRNAFGSVWEVSHMELRLALAAEGKGATFVSDLMTTCPKGSCRSKVLPFSNIERAGRRVLPASSAAFAGRVRDSSRSAGEMGRRITSIGIVG